MIKKSSVLKSRLIFEILPIFVLLIFISFMIRTDFGMVYISVPEGVDPEMYFEFVQCIKVQGTQVYFEVMAGRPIT